MGRQTIKIGGRVFTLAFSLNTMARMQDEVPGFDFNNLNESIRKPKGLIDIIYHMAISGAALEGQKLDIDREWMAERIPATVKQLGKIQLAVNQTLTEAMTMETEEEDKQDREVDVVLEEIKKKDEKTD